MNRTPHRLGLTRWLLAGLGLGLAAVPAARSQTAAAPPALPLAIVRAEGASLPSVLDPAAPAWEQARPTRLILSRSPRIHQTEPPGPPPPGAEVRALRVGPSLVMRLTWADATRDAPEVPPARTGEAGVPERIYKRPTGETSTFADAAAVMLPAGWKGGDFPSLVMGDQHAPAALYSWNASRGTDVMTAAGRATTARSGRPFPSQVRHADGRWTLTLELPAPGADPYPVAFAFWDGASEDRDGRKSFSVWYALTGSAGAQVAAQGANTR